MGEHSDTHRFHAASWLMGFASLHPSYEFWGASAMIALPNWMSETRHSAPHPKPTVKLAGDLVNIAGDLPPRHRPSLLLIRTLRRHRRHRRFHLQPFRRQKIPHRAAQARMSYIMCRIRRPGQISALNLRSRDVLYGRNWGSTEDVPFLHFELCYYQAIDYAIAHGMKRVEAGAQGEHKIQRGYLPRPTYSAHYIRHAGLRRAVGDFLEAERLEMEAAMTAMTQESPYKKE